MARPRKKIDFIKLDELISIFCTGEECASILDIDYDTLNTRLKEEKGMSFSEYFKHKSADGKASLRRTQFVMAQKNPRMAEWLGKQHLGQTDKQQIQSTFEGDVRFTDKYKEYSNKLLRRLNIPV